MVSKSKKILCILLLIVIAISSYFLWLSNRPVKIVAVHQDGNFSSVLVRNFPFTDKGKINWWLENKNNFKDKYKVPSPAQDGFYSVTFWDFGDGYKEEGKYDRRCFNDMKTNKNCIDKKAVFSVRHKRDNTISFTVYDGTYSLLKNGNIVTEN